MAKIDIIKIVAGIVLLRGATGSSTTSILLRSKFQYGILQNNLWTAFKKHAQWDNNISQTQDNVCK